jgi:hypothetical protein
MPFQIRLHDDYSSGLVATCDVCGQRLESAAANLLWLPSAENQTRPGTFSEFKLACKEPCTLILDAQAGEEHYWQPLNAAIGYLLTNTRTDAKAMHRTIRTLDRMAGRIARERHAAPGQ